MVIFTVSYILDIESPEKLKQKSGVIFLDLSKNEHRYFFVHLL